MPGLDILNSTLRFIGFENSDPLLSDGLKLVVKGDNASASYLQRKLNIGYARAARLLDELQQMGIVGPADGASTRKILINTEELDDFLKGIIKPSDEEVDDFSFYQVPKLPTDLTNFVPKLWTIPFGRDENNKDLSFDLDQIGHLLVVGNPYSQKMAFADAVICSQLLTGTPNQVRFILIDTSGQLGIYKHIPHLLSPVITDYEKGLSAFKWVMTEVDRRQKIFAERGVRSFSAFENLPEAVHLPRIIVICQWQETADREFEYILSKVTGIAHFAGIHFFFFYDYAGSKYLPASVKANLPNRLVFQTTTAQDSRLVGVIGGEKLAANMAILNGIGEYKNSNLVPFLLHENITSKIIASIQK